MKRGTKIILVVFGVMFLVGVGILFMARQAMNKYVEKSKSTEGRIGVRSIFSRARSAAQETGAFPPGKTGPVPPAGSCCDGPDGQCAPDPSLWEEEPWSAIEFEEDMPHRYSYEYEVDLSGALTVRAIGDLDCDGSFSTFQVTGTVDGPEPEVTQVDPLE